MTLLPRGRADLTSVFTELIIRPATFVRRARLVGFEPVSQLGQPPSPVSRFLRFADSGADRTCRSHTQPLAYGVPVDVREKSLDYLGRTRFANYRLPILHYGLSGAEVVGPRIEHMALLLAWAVQTRLTAADVLDLPLYHPVLEEGMSQESLGI